MLPVRDIEKHSALLLETNCGQPLATLPDMLVRLPLALVVRLVLTRYIGSALAIKNWAWQLTHSKDELLPGESPYPNEAALIDSVKEALETGKQKAGRGPKILVIGAVSLARIRAFTDK